MKAKGTESGDGKNVIGSRLILKNKLNEEGILIKRKARVVGKGYSQLSGVDFKETFAPVVRLESIRLLMALAVEMNLRVYQLDVTTAFLNADINEQIFMEIPEFFE